MKKFFMLLFFSLLFLYNSALLSAQGKYTWSFTITGKYDKPLVGAVLSSYSSTNTVATDEKGSAKFRSTDGYVIIKADGYKKYVKEMYGIPYGNMVEIQLTPLPDKNNYKTVDVFVKDSKGKPIRGVTIAAVNGINSSTDETGYVMFQHSVPEGEYLQIEASANGFETQSQRYMIGTGQG